jgi:hypothetical protein
MQETLDKERMISKLIIRKLQKDIDITKERIGVGKTIYKDMELDDEEEVAFIEMYCEFSIQKMQLYADLFEIEIKECILFFKETIKQRLIYIVNKIFQTNKKLKGFNANLKDLEVDMGVEEDVFIVQVNLTAGEKI